MMKVWSCLELSKSTYLQINLEANGTAPSLHRLVQILHKNAIEVDIQARLIADGVVLRQRKLKFDLLQNQIDKNWEE